MSTSNLNSVCEGNPDAAKSRIVVVANTIEFRHDSNK
jgi:hypothetical protein